MRHGLALVVLSLVLGLFFAVPPPAAAPPPGAWTFLVYMDADNNLEPWGIADFQEMARVGSSAMVNIVVEMDRAPGFDASHGNWTDTRRFYVTKDLTPDAANNLPSWTPREINMADPANLTDFVEWGMETYPAQHYFLVLWDHGDGWQGVVADDDPVPSDRLNATELSAAMRAVVAATGRRVDVIGNDACRMTLEIDYELADYADYFVGSEKDEPLAGWPYDTWLAAVAANPMMSPPEVGSTLADKYVESYANNSQYSVAISVVNAGGLRPLVAALDAFLREVSSGEPYFTAQVVQAREATERYEGAGGSCCGQEYDLYDFVENAIGAIPSRRVERAGTDLQAAIEAAVVYERHWDNPSPYNGVHAAQAHGISLFFQTGGGGPAYDSLALSRDSAWNEFLSTYALGTRAQVEVALDATATSVDTNADGYLDTLVLQSRAAMNASLAVDVYRDGAYVFSRQYVAAMGRTDEIRYLFFTGGVYEVTAYVLDAGKVKNVSVAKDLVIEQLVTFRGRVSGENGASLDGATVTLVNLANNRTASTTSQGGSYVIAVAYPTWFRQGDPLELRVVAGDREARLQFNATAEGGTVLHDVFLNSVGMGPWIAALAVLAALAAAGLAGTLYFWRRLRRFKKIP